VGAGGERDGVSMRYVSPPPSFAASFILLRYVVSLSRYCAHATFAAMMPARVQDDAYAFTCYIRAPLEIGYGALAFTAMLLTPRVFFAARVAHVTVSARLMPPLRRRRSCCAWSTPGNCKSRYAFSSAAYRFSPCLRACYFFTFSDGACDFSN